MCPSTPLSEAIRRYIDSTGRVGSERTAAHYHALARRLSAYLDRDALLSDLTDETVGRWIRERRKQVKPNTIRGEAAKLLAVWRWTARKGWTIAPDIQVPRRGDRAPRAMSRREIRQLWRAAHKSTDTIGGVPGRLYWPAMLGLLWDTAERVGAVQALRWADIDLRSRCVYFRAESRKGRIQDARKRFTRQTARVLRRLERHNTPTPFASIKQGALYYHWGLLRDAAGLPEDITPHTLRRSHATYLRLAGGDAQASLGHSSDEITTRHYIDHTLDSVQPCDLIPRQPGWWARLWAG